MGGWSGIRHFFPSFQVESLVFFLWRVYANFYESQYVCECDECVICFVEFVLSSKDSSELLDITEVSFYNVASLVQLFLVLPRFLVIALRWNNRYHAALFCLCSTRIAFIRLVHEERFVLANLFRNSAINS